MSYYINNDEKYFSILSNYSIFAIHRFSLLVKIRMSCKYSDPKHLFRNKHLEVDNL